MSDARVSHTKIRVYCEISFKTQRIRRGTHSTGTADSGRRGGFSYFPNVQHVVQRARIRSSLTLPLPGDSLCTCQSTVNRQNASLVDSVPFAPSNSKAAVVVVHPTYYLHQ